MNGIERAERWLEIMDSVKSQHSVIASLIGDKSVAYLDIPVYFNVGDLLIYLGTEEFFNKNNINVIYRSDCKNVNLKKLNDADVIVYQGGGNFGDLYHRHQKLREDIVKQFPNKRIICLPQSIYFEKSENEEASAHIFSKHKDFHFITRDERSFEHSKKFTDHVYLLPDMAHSLHPMIEKDEISEAKPSQRRVLNLIRKDIESSKNGLRLNKKGFDWDDIIQISDIKTKKKYSSLAKWKFKQNKANELWYKLSKEIAFRSENYFHLHNEVHTDRLHGLIFACLLGKNIHLYDNSYGKNSSYYKKWLFDMPNIHLDSSI